MFDGKNGSRIFWKHAVAALDNPACAILPLGRLYITKIEIDIAIKVLQSRIQVDRAARYAFVLAVEDQVRQVMTIASRGVNDKITALQGPIDEPPDAAPGPTLQNGSIFTVFLRPFFDFNEVADLPKGEFRDEIGQSAPSNTGGPTSSTA